MRRGWLRRRHEASSDPAASTQGASSRDDAVGATGMHGTDRAEGAGGTVGSANLEADGAVFVCSTCGRTDLPPAAGWDPPICQECDAAINEEALMEDPDY